MLDACNFFEDGIYEIRIEVGSNIYRIFTFFDDNKLVILLHGFQKKVTKNTEDRNRTSQEIKEELL